MRSGGVPGTRRYASYRLPCAHGGGPEPPCLPPGWSGRRRSTGVFRVLEPIAVLTVCTTCRMGLPYRDGVLVAGQVLHDRLSALLSQANATPVRLHGVECLAVCNDGCAAAIAQPGKWSYLLGRLTPDKAADLLVFAGSYHASRTGTVMPSKRPSSLADMILGRVPSLAAETAA